MPKAVAALLVILFSLIGPVAASAHKWDSGDTAALIGGALLGGAAAAAISNQHQHEYQYAPAPPPQRAAPKAPFSPAAGVICYPSQAACYGNNGHFNPAWTRRIY
jgi:hypothetical protein